MEDSMHGFDLKPLSIETLAALRDDVLTLLAGKVADRQKELEGEIARINGLNGAKTPKAKHPHKALLIAFWAAHNITSGEWMLEGMDFRCAEWCRRVLARLLNLSV
jgi:hypothetical protein